MVSWSPPTSSLTIPEDPNLQRRLVSERIESMGVTLTMGNY